VDKFVQMQVFVAVAETEGFASGARRLNISPPAGLYNHVHKLISHDWMSIMEQKRKYYHLLSVF
jgi:hypothetical protein